MCLLCDARLEMTVQIEEKLLDHEDEKIIKALYMLSHAVNDPRMIAVLRQAAARLDRCATGALDVEEYATRLTRIHQEVQNLPDAPAHPHVNTAHVAKA